MGSADWEGALGPLLDRYGLSDRASAYARLVGRLAQDPHAPTAIREPADVRDRHLADSLVALELQAVRDARQLADLGSGTGLPGVALALALPASEVSLVESQQGKCSYLASLVAELGLENVRVVCSRAEQWRAGLGAHDVVVARALAPQPAVLEYAAPLLALGGHLVDWRGRRDREEEDRAQRAAGELGLRRCDVLQVHPFAGASDRHLHVFEKVAATPERFPRRPGLAARRPLGGAPQG